MTLKKVRLATESSVAAAIPGLVQASLSEDETIRDTVNGLIGELATDNHALSAAYPTYQSAARLAQSATGAIVLQIDDGRVCSYDIAAPLVEATGGRLTLGITTDWLGKNGYMSVTQMQTLAGRGHEMAWHSKDHPRMSDLTAAERMIQWDAKEALEGMLAGVSGQPVTTAIYPHLAMNAETTREAYGRFNRVYVGQSAPYIHSPYSTAPFQSGRFSWHGTGSQASALNLVRQAARERSVVTIFTHFVDRADGGVETWQLEELCNLAVELGVPFITARDALPDVPQFPNSGFEDTDLSKNYGFRNVNASNTIESVTDAPQAGYPGKRSLRIRGDGSVDVSALAAYPPISINADQMSISCRLRLLKRGGNGAGAYLSVEQYNLMDEALPTLRGHGVAQSQGWGQYRWDFTPHTECTHVRIRLGLDRLDADAFFDHLHIGPTRLGALG